MKRTLLFALMTGLLAMCLHALTVHHEGVVFTVALPELNDVNGNGLSDFYARTPDGEVSVFEQTTTTSLVFEKIAEAEVYDNTQEQSGHETTIVDLKPPPPPPPPPPDVDVLCADLTAAYPNPFNPTTSIRFGLNQPAVVKVTIYNQRGQMVKEFAGNPMDEGLREVVWDGRDNSGKSVSSGVYLFRVSTEKESVTRKIMLLK